MIVAYYHLSSAPPALNNAFPTGKNGRRYKSRGYSNWQNVAGLELMSQEEPAIVGDYNLLISVGAKESRADIDNLIKPISDLLVKYGATADDANMQSVTIMRARDYDGVRIWVFKTREESGAP